jgi:hypothetical protein
MSSWRATSGAAADLADVTQAARSFRATAIRHPWLAPVLGQAGLAYLGPSLTSVSGRLAVLFTTAGFPDPRPPWIPWRHA